MAADLASVGIYYNKAGIKLVRSHLKRVGKTNGGTILENGNIRRLSLLCGPGGCVNIVSIWKRNKLITAVTRTGNK